MCLQSFFVCFHPVSPSKLNDKILGDSSELDCLFVMKVDVVLKNLENFSFNLILVY